MEFGSSLQVAVSKSLKQTPPRVWLLDAPPGSGKSYTVVQLVKYLFEGYRAKSIICVNSNNCVAQYDSQRPCATVLTCCKLLMRGAGLSFAEARDFYCDKTATVQEMWYKMYQTAFGCSWAADVLILDEYTVVSPWLIILLYIFCRIRSIPFIIVGDQHQQGAISKSVHYKRNNYVLASLLAGDDIVTLTTQYRIVDESYKNLLSDLKGLMRVGDDTPVSFVHIYSIFTQLRAAFLRRPKREHMYLAARHEQLSTRMAAWDKSAACQAPYRYASSGEPIVLPPSPTFLHYLPLVVGCPYLHYVDRIRTMVTLISVTPDAVYVRPYESSETTSILRVHREPLVSWVVGEYNWILNAAKCTESRQVLQFPLRPMCLTYSVVQGLTIPTMKLDLDFNKASLNAIYVGMSRVTEPAQIYSISSTETINCLLTELYNDEYYYRIRAPTMGLVEYLCGSSRDVGHPLVPLRESYEVRTPAGFKAALTGRCLRTTLVDYVRNMQERKVPLLEITSSLINAPIYTDRITLDEFVAVAVAEPAPPKAAVKRKYKQ